MSRRRQRAAVKVIGGDAALLGDGEGNVRTFIFLNDSLTDLFGFLNDVGPEWDLILGWDLLCGQVLELLLGSIFG